MSPKKKSSAQAIPDGFRPADDSGIPVPSRALLITTLREQGVPLDFDTLSDLFKLQDHPKSKQAIAAFESRLERMAGRGMLLLDRRGRYSLPDKMDLVVGHVLGHEQGFGFVTPEEGGDDLYLHPRQMRRVLHKDKVLAVTRRIDSRGRKEGAIVEVIVKQDREIVGRFFEEGGAYFVDPDDGRFGREVVIPKEETGGAKSGDVVVVRITKHPIEHRHVVGRVAEILGEHMAPGMETDIAVRKHELPHEFPDAVAKQMKSMGGKLKQAKHEKGREDIRNLPLVTIDGIDARDFDDAVFAEFVDNQWRLIVAIADVSHYVQPDSSLDEEAYRRGTSVYFPNRVIPMLPEQISNGICSLMPKVDRHCMVCDMQFDATGKLVDYRFYPATMHSHGRLTYAEMAQIVSEQNAQAREKRAEIVSDLDALFDLYQLLVSQRKQRGTIDFDFPEPLILYNEDQKIQSIERRERNDAHRLIEECMLSANICAAQFIEQNSKEGGIYRNHEGPDIEALTDLRKFLSGFGLQLEGGDKPGAADYARVLDKLQEQPDLAPLVQVVLLRSLKQAVYAADNLGHFALNYPEYSHFTSPIRRYPDLVVHRLIRRITKKQAPNGFGPNGQSMAQIGEHCSFTERRADDASRDVVQWLKAEYMQDFIGDVFDGHISGVKDFGIFVELHEAFIDGLVHVTMMGNDYYHYDPQHFQMTGERTGLRFRLGDEVEVRVLKSDVETGKIDFELISLKGQEVDTSRGARSVKRSKKSHHKGGKKSKGDTKAKSSKKSSKKSKSRSRSSSKGRSRGSSEAGKK